ncbi:MAG: S1 family peptidase [Solirubrobacterales bacterium]
MPGFARMAGIHAFAFAGITVIGLCFSLISVPERAGAARTSIVNGKSASIEDWPWQVGLAVSRRSAPLATPRARFFCGGSLIAPQLVLTAGHCVADLNRRQVREVDVISGRTRLNDESSGEVAGAVELLMPVDSRGKRRYRQRFGVANWDFALLRLDRHLNAETIKIAGEDEISTWSPGRIVKTTGYGVTGPARKKGSPVLRVASQVMLDDSVCRRLNGNLFNRVTMNCMGGPQANTSSCFGDSGGPLVAPIVGGYRLMGATSFGDSLCRPVLPSIDARIAGNPMRDWIRTTSMRVTGIDVVGSGGIAPPERTWCKIPKLKGLTVPEARRSLEAGGCRLGSVRPDYYSADRWGRVTGASMVAGWLTRVGHPVRIFVAR